MEFDGSFDFLGGPRLAIRVAYVYHRARPYALSPDRRAILEASAAGCPTLPVEHPAASIVT